MTTVKNEIFIDLLRENFYLVWRELTIVGGRNCSRCGVNEQIFGYWGDYPLSPSRESPADIYIIYIIYIHM